MSEGAVIGALLVVLAVVACYMAILASDAAAPRSADKFAPRRFGGPYS